MNQQHHELAQQQALLPVPTPLFHILSILNHRAIGLIGINCTI